MGDGGSPSLQIYGQLGGVSALEGQSRARTLLNSILHAARRLSNQFYVPHHLVGIFGYNVAEKIATAHDDGQVVSQIMAKQARSIRLQCVAGYSFLEHFGTSFFCVLTATLPNFRNI